MRQPLWIINSTLITVMLCMMAMLLLLAREYRATLARALPRTPTLSLPEAVDVEKFTKIYEEDLFDTFRPAKVPIEERPIIGEIPLPPVPEFTPPPKPAAPKLIDPLNVTLRGIMFSPQAERCMVLIEDEAAKEKTFVLGEKIKDAQLIKINRDRIVLLRANSQHETLFLRPPVPPEGATKNWNNVVKMINPAAYELDLENFKKEVSSLGQLFETLGIATAYAQNKPIGLRIDTITKRDLGQAMGLQNGDILTAIDDTSLATLNERVSAFKHLGSLAPGEKVTVHLLRKQAPMQLTYTMSTLTKQTPPFGRQPEGSIEQNIFKRSPMQQRLFEQQQFNAQHTQEREAALQEIRQRLLENMKMRQRDFRIQ